jgi:hypothetical protein
METRVLLLAALLAGCAGPKAGGLSAAQDTFWANLRPLCGKAFEGRIAAKVGGGPGPDPYDGKRLVLHGAHCTDEAVRLDLHVGAEDSKTWVFTRAAEGLRLVHEQRKADGSPDSLTGYGGMAEGRGTPDTQRFPADGLSKTLFVREDLPQSADNVWVVTLLPDKLLRYALQRPGREFRLEFDLTAPVANP